MKVKCLAIKAACLLGKCITGIITLALILVAYFAVIGGIVFSAGYIISILPTLIQNIIFGIALILCAGLVLLMVYAIGDSVFEKYNIKLCKRR